MSRTKDMLLTDKNNINIYKIFSKFLGKGKYGELVTRIFADDDRLKDYNESVIKNFTSTLGVTKEAFEGLNNLEIMYLQMLTQTVMKMDTFKELVKFVDYNERKLIPDNDLQQYKDFNKIFTENEKVDEKLNEKKLAKERIILFEHGDWMVILPLTYEASKKYGANTKWCTASDKTSAQFISYTKDGCLIYNVNTRTGDKVAVHKYLNSSKITFWDAKDHQVDSIETDLSDEVMSFIKKYIKSKNLKPNSKMISTKRGLKIKKENTSLNEVTEGTDLGTTNPCIEITAQDIANFGSVYMDINEVVSKSIGGSWLDTMFNTVRDNGQL